MIEKLLPIISDPEDYISALALFKAEPPLTGEEADRLRAIYEKYYPIPGEPEFAAVCVAVDLLPGRTEADKAVFAPLKLGENNLHALFLAKGILSGKHDPTVESAGEIVALVQGEKLNMAVRVLLARAALDMLSGAGNYVELYQQIISLAEFLTGCGPEVLDRYTILVGEVRSKCKE